MAADKTTTAPRTAPFEITRTFQAPLAEVWKAWSDAERIGQWWGPKGCTVEVVRFEFRPGGFFHYAMQFPGAPGMWGRFAYRDIEVQRRIVWLNSFANEHCGIARAPFSADCPLEIENTVAFTEKAGATTLTLRALPFGENDAERRFFEELRGSSLAEGYGGTLDQLAGHLGRR